ncbi:MAG: Gfo/Idh/MocA family oxidoreductase [bacterium]
MVKVGMVGMGGMGSHHAATLAGMPNAKVLYTCDLIQERADKAAAATGAKAITDFRQMLDDVDAVYVCTEPFNRVDVVTACAEAGKHIFMEKPVCINLEGAEKMVAACKKAKVKLMLGYVLRFWSPFNLIKYTLDSGELGDLVTVFTQRFMPVDMRSVWYGDQSKSGGITLDFGSHDIDWVRWVGGDVKTVFGQVARIRPGVNADEHVQGMMLFQNGGWGSICDSWGSFLGDSQLGVVGTKGAIIVDRGGIIRKKVGDGEEEILSEGGDMSIDPKGNLGKGAPSKDETIQQHFIRSVEEDFTPLVTGDDGIAVWKIVFGILESAKTGKAVDIV